MNTDGADSECCLSAVRALLLNCKWTNAAAVACVGPHRIVKYLLVWCCSPRSCKTAGQIEQQISVGEFCRQKVQLSEPHSRSSQMSAIPRFCGMMNSYVFNFDLWEWSGHRVLDTSKSNQPAAIPLSCDSGLPFGCRAGRSRERWVCLGSVRCYRKSSIVRWGSGDTSI